MSGDPLAAIAAGRIVPVIVLDNPEDAPSLADALVDGGIRIAEFTLRTPAGRAAIQSLAGRDDLLVGAGTVTSLDQVESAASAGASFVVSPGLDPAIVNRCLELHLDVLPGVATATELQAASRLGLSHVKIFPAAVLGGLELISALSGPFPDLRFMPSGGITVDTAGDYLAHPAVFAVGASWIASRSAIADGDFDGIRSRAHEAVSAFGGPQ
jgi:2-dehydro-3-deoxyphosphogluconate aldolase/(4S)-4-hydroxy-2-oxoglutarate aldolase